MISILIHLFDGATYYLYLYVLGTYCLLFFASRFWGRGVFGRRAREGDEFHTAHEGYQHFRDLNAFFGLVVFENAADGAAGRAQRRIQHVGRHGILVIPRFGVHPPRLEIEAIRCRNQFAILALPVLVPRKPSLQIVFFRRGVVQFPANNVNNVIRQPQRLIKPLRRIPYLLVFFIRFVLVHLKS